MLDERWAERCRSQHIHLLTGDIPARVTIYGCVLARDTRGAYPIGGFELCGEAVIYPPQTLNTLEEQAMLASATGLTQLWDKTGILTVRFIKQRDGSDFALLDIEEMISPEARHLLALRGYRNDNDDMFPPPGEPAPGLLELTKVGVSYGETLYIADTLRAALLQLPDSVRASFVGWYEKVLNHDR